MSLIWLQGSILNPEGNTGGGGAASRQPHRIGWRGGINPLGIADLQLDAGDVADWQPNTWVQGGTYLRGPEGRLFYVNSDFTTGATFGATPNIEIGAFYSDAESGIRPHVRMHYYGMDARLNQELPADFDFQHWRAQIGIQCSNGRPNGFGIIVGGNRPDSDETLSGYDRGLIIYHDLQITDSPHVELRRADGTASLIPATEGDLQVHDNYARIFGNTHNIFETRAGDAGYPRDFDEPFHILTLEFQEGTLWYYWNDERINYPEPRARYIYAAASNPFRAGAPVGLNFAIQGAGDSPTNAFRLRVFSFHIEEYYASGR